jgi:hypothetical protein
LSLSTFVFRRQTKEEKEEREERDVLVGQSVEKRSGGSSFASFLSAGCGSFCVVVRCETTASANLTLTLSLSFFLLFFSFPLLFLSPSQPPRS